MHKISHSRSMESMAEKARWFRTLSVEERLDMLVFLTDVALRRNPAMAEKVHDQPSSDRIRVITPA